MSEERAYRTPFVLGKPIKNPADFYGRSKLLRGLFQALLQSQRVAVVGEHRCGNTSVLYQLLHPEVRARHLSPAEDHSLVFVFVSCQLAGGSPGGLLRRIAVALRRADEEADGEVDPAAVDQAWLLSYLEQLADRHKRLVLLLDEFEVLAELDPAFWDWFEVLANEYDVAIIASTRTDLSQYRTEHGGPPFFNTFRSDYMGSFTPTTVDLFLRDKTELTDFDFVAVRDVIQDLAGRFPFYMQMAAALIYVTAGGEPRLSAAQLETVQREFRSQTGKLFEDAWNKLPAPERQALSWLAIGEAGQGVSLSDEVLTSLERRGYLIDGRIFSSPFRDFIHQHLRHIAVDDGSARVGIHPLDLPPKELAFLAYFTANEGSLLSRDDIAMAVWPEHSKDAVTDAMIEKTISRLRQGLEDVEPGSGDAVESVRGHGYRLLNRPLEAGQQSGAG